MISCLRLWLEPSLRPLGAATLGGASASPPPLPALLTGCLEFEQQTLTHAVVIGWCLMDNWKVPVRCTVGRRGRHRCCNKFHALILGTGQRLGGRLKEKA